MRQGRRHCFNPRPALSNGATDRYDGQDLGCGVSIRAPLSRTGRHRIQRVEVSRLWFQSAPRSLERGDQTEAEASGLIAGFNPRPALSNGATAPTSQPLPAGAVSIRAPLSRTGRPRGSDAARSDCPVSIRAPLSRTGRHRHHAAWEVDGAVSIRAPLSRTGRRLRPWWSASNEMFQSAPRSLERGDTTAPRTAVVSLVFQSAPRSLERGDLAFAFSISVVGWFQSATRSLERGDHPGMVR